MLIDGVINFPQQSELFKIRKQKGFTKKDLALLTGIHSERIGKIEGLMETPTFEEIEELSVALRVRKEKLFSAEILNEIEQKHRDSMQELSRKYIGPRGWGIRDIQEKGFLDCNYCW